MHSVQRREKNGSISIKPFAPYFKTNDSYQNFSHQHFIFDFFIRRAFRTRVRYDGHISGCFTSVGQAESHPQVMSTLQARHRWNFQIITIIWSHYHIDTFQPLAAFGWRNHLAFLCFHALSPWVSLDWILTGQLGLWKLRGFPSSQLNRMESSSQPTTLRWSNMSRVFNFLFVETTCEGDNSRGKRLRPGLFISAGRRVWHGDYYQHAATFFFKF